MFLRLIALALMLGCVVSSEAFAAPPISLDAEAIQHLDLKTALPKVIGAIPLAKAPARVVIPPAKEFAVTSLQSAIITRPEHVPERTKRALEPIVGKYLT